MYELFISYAKADHQWVQGFLLPKLGLSPEQVITTSQFQIGKSLINEVERSIKTSRYVVLILTPAYINDEWASFGEQIATYANVSGQKVRLIPIKLKEVTLPLHIDYLISLDFRLEEKWITEIVRLRDFLQLSEPVPELIPCPYPGLRSFTKDNAGIFFGRDDEVNDLINRLRYHHFIAVIGASGSGKSSLIYAGLVYQLYKSSFFSKDSWLIRDMRPGDQPVQRINELLEGDLATDPGTTICNLLEQNKPSERLLLIIDQYEELFNLSSQEEQNKFTKILQTLRYHPDCYILLCMRAAFYQDLMGSKLWPIDSSERLDLVPLRDEALAKAIEKPAAGLGVFLEPELLERLLFDAANEPGVLPLMQEAMVLLWEKRANRLITFQSYKKLGKSGLAVAMANKADATYNSLFPEQQLMARRIFLRLVQFGEGRPDTRRQQSVSELRSTDDNLTEFTTCVNHLVNNRLLTFNAEADSKDPKVDIAHESLIDGWPKLQGWIKERRESEQVRRRLEQKANEWIRLGRKEGGMLDATEILEANVWLNSQDAKELGFSNDLKVLSETSQAALAAMKEAEELSRLKEIKDVRRRNAILSAVAIVALGAFLGALLELKIADSQELAAKALSYIGGQLDLALLRSSEGYDRDNNMETRSSLLSTLGQSPHLRKFLHGHSAFAWKVKISPNGKTFVSGHSDGTIRFWDLINEKPLTDPIIGHSQAVNTLAFSIDGKTVASASNDGTIVLWDVITKKSTDTLFDKGNDISALAYSQDGKILASCGSDKQITLWDANTHVLIDSLSAHQETVYCLAFSPDGKTMASGSFDETVILWDLVTHKPKGKPLDEHGGRVHSLAFSPDGTLLASGSGGDVVRNLIIWDVANQLSLGDYLIGHNEDVMDLLFSQTGDTLFSCDAGRKIIQWNMNTYLPTDNLFVGHRDQVNSIDIAPNGKTLVSSGWDNNIILWGLTVPNFLGKKLYQYPFAVEQLTFSSDKKHVLSGDSRGSIAFHEVDQKPVINFLSQMTQGSNCIALSTDRKMIASGQADGTLTVWKVATRQSLYPSVKLHDSAISCIAFNIENTVIATGSDDGTVRLWDIASHKPVGLPLKIHRGEVNMLTFSPDGLTLAVCYDRCTVTLFDTKTWKPSRYIVLTNEDKSSVSGVTSAKFDPTGKVLAISTDQIPENSILLWYINTGKLVKYESEGEAIFSLGFNPNKAQIATGGFNGTINIRDITSGHNQIFKPIEGIVKGLAYSPSGKRLAIGYSTNKIIRLYDTKSGNLTDTLVNHTKGIKDILFIDENTLASVSQNGEIIIWNLTTHKASNKPLNVSNNINCLALSPDGHTVVSGDNNGNILFWDAYRKQNTKLFKLHTGPVNYVDFSPDGHLLATCSSDTNIKLWNVLTQTVIGSFPKGHKSSIACVKFSPDSELLASAGSDGQIIFWNIKTRKLISSLPKRHSTGGVKRIIFSPDGQILASSGYDRLVLLWDVNKGQLIGSPLMAHENVIWSLAFSPDGKFLASGGNDKKINLWDISTRDHFGASIMASDKVWALAFSPDNQFLLSGQQDGTVTRWDLDPKKWVEKAKHIANFKEE